LASTEPVEKLRARPVHDPGPPALNHPSDDALTEAIATQLLLLGGQAVGLLDPALTRLGIAQRQVRVRHPGPLGEDAKGPVDEVAQVHPLGEGSRELQRGWRRLRHPTLMYGDRPKLRKRRFERN